MVTDFTGINTLHSEIKIKVIYNSTGNETPFKWNTYIVHPYDSEMHFVVFAIDKYTFRVVI